MSTDVFVRGSGTGPVQRRRWTGPLLAVLVVVGGIALVYEPPSSGVTYDPRSRSPDGLAVVVDVLDELGVEVRVEDSLPAADEVDAVLAPPLGWAHPELLGLAADGTRVVATVPPDPDAEPVELAFTGIGLVTREVTCPLLADVSALRSTTWSAWQVEAGTLPTGTRRCVRDGSAAWLTVVEVGDGELVSLGTFAPLVNDRMLEEDAAVAAVRLLAVSPGDRVVALTEPGASAGTPRLLDLVDRRWFDAAWLTLLVLALAASARGRRLGRPVTEELPVRVPSGELARALGDLHHRIGADAAAVGTLRTRTLTLVGERLGIGATPDGEEAVLALRAAGIELDDADAHVLRHRVGDRADADTLTGAARRLAAIRAAVRRGAPTRTSPPTHDDADRAPTSSTDDDRRTEQP